MVLSEDDIERFGRAIWPDLTGRPATAVNQARFGLSRLLPILDGRFQAGASILEVGAGPLLLSAYLASKGFRVTALEPLTPDFSWFAALQSDVTGFCAQQGIALERIDAMAEDYVAPERYDVIFTIHVLEHMRDPLRALGNMHRSLAEHGVILAVCPNYDVPFEPHLGILLVGRSKSVNAWLYPRRVAAKPEVWRGLFFIRYSRLKRYLGAAGMTFSFSRGVVRDMFLRLGEDQFLYARMPTLVRLAYRGLRRTGLIGLMGWLPVRWQTPMELVVTK
jgi:2-polyprenyl-3-methyl-5-hydroxy-6-metoxy-1,4-benzoquinol methylase